MSPAVGEAAHRAVVQQDTRNTNAYLDYEEDDGILRVEVYGIDTLKHTTLRWCLDHRGGGCARCTECRRHDGKVDTGKQVEIPRLDLMTPEVIQCNPAILRWGKMVGESDFKEEANARGSPRQPRDQAW